MGYKFIRNEHPRGYIEKLTSVNARTIFLAQKYKLTKAQKIAHKAFLEWRKLYNRVEKEKSGLVITCMKLDELCPGDKKFRDSRKTNKKYADYIIQKVEN